MAAPVDMIEPAARELSAHLRRRVVTVEREVPVDALGSRADAVVELEGGIRFAVEAMRAQRALPLVDAARRAVAEAAALEAEALVVAPYISPTVAAGIWEEGANLLDLSGNARIFVAEPRGHPGGSRRELARRRERPPRIWVHVHGRPNAFPERGRPQTAFGPGGARIARLLLLDPTRWWRQSELVAASRLSSGGVSKIVARLSELEQLERGPDREVRLAHPAELLDAWAKEYSWARYEVIDAHLPGRGGADATMRLAAALAELDPPAWAMTGMSAAWLLDEYASFRIATAYVTGNPDQVLNAVGAERVERGPNLQLLMAPDAGVFDGATRVRDTQCVAPVQVYLDLLQMPERADEAARELRARHLAAVDA
ncbi:MAG: type IV toxin-antitoxin system AbiEi family antitoxin [Actinomycetota bacterium]